MKTKPYYVAKSTIHPLTNTIYHPVRPVAKEPTTKSGQSSYFVQRILDSLEVDLDQLAERLNIDRQELIWISRATRGKILSIDQDEVWILVADYVEKRIGLLMSVREEMQRKLNSDRRKRALLRHRIQNR